MADCRYKTKSLALLIALLAVVSIAHSQQVEKPTLADKISKAEPDSLQPTEPFNPVTVLHPDSTWGEAPPAKPEPTFPEENIPPYLETDLCIRSFGDYFSHQPGTYSLQQGSFFQSEMLTKSIMLPGLACEYNGVPFIGQGAYFPFRAGLDMSNLMYEDVGQVEITPLNYLSLFNEGEILSLRSMSMPDSSNPSSVSIGRGPYGYERAGWRFSRRFNEAAGFVFTAGFRQATGLYSEGADYDDFNVNGAFTYRIRPSLEFQYGFYQHKAKQGVVQFDRVYTPLLRNNHDENLHRLSLTRLLSENLSIGMNIHNQENYSHLFDETSGSEQFIRDHVWGGQTDLKFNTDKHSLTLAAGGSRHSFSSKGYSSGRLVTMAAFLSDSIKLNPDINLSINFRGRHNNIDDFTFNGTSALRYVNAENLYFDISGGLVTGSPDIYARRYTHPEWIGNDSISTSYSYIPAPDLKSTKSVFGAGEVGLQISNSLSGGARVSFEDVINDRIPIVSRNGNEYTSTQQNIDYDRITVSGWLHYNLSRYYKGKVAATFFSYSPSEVIDTIKFAPSAIISSSGIVKFKEVLRTIDLAGSFEVRYYSERQYAGLFRGTGELAMFEPVVVIDAAFIITFGAFEFRLCEDNVLDFILNEGNDYGLWGQYAMPPGNVWWQFTWNFKN